MNLNYTEEHQLLRNSLQAYLQAHYSFESRRVAHRSGTGWRPPIWKAFAKDLGILSAAFQDAVDTMIIMEELGAALVVEPYLESVVFAGGLLQRIGGALCSETLRKIVAGEHVVAVAWAEPQSRYNYAHVHTVARREGKLWRLYGCKAMVIAAPWADQFIVTARTGGELMDADGVSLFLIDADHLGVRLSPYPTIDGKEAADIVFDGVLVPEDQLLGKTGKALPLIEAAGNIAITALGAEALGVMRRLLEDTVAYTKERHQFGQPVANFQVLQHRMVDMYLQLEMAKSAVLRAALSLDNDAVERAKAVSAAKVIVARACRFVGQNAVQLHGGIGTSDALALGHYFKRATVIESELGGVDHHLDRFTALAG